MIASTPANGTPAISSETPMIIAWMTGDADDARKRRRGRRGGQRR